MKKNIIKLLFVSLFLIGACGSSTDTTTCSYSDDMYVTVYESKDDKIISMKQTIAIDLKEVGFEKEDAESFVKMTKDSLDSIEGVSVDSKVDDKKMSITVNVDFEKGKLDTFVSQGLISENLIKEKDGEDYVSLKKAKEEFKTQRGEECK